MSASEAPVNPQTDPTNFYFNERQNPYEERLGRRSENNANSVRYHYSTERLHIRSTNDANIIITFTGWPPRQKYQSQNTGRQTRRTQYAARAGQAGRPEYLGDLVWSLSPGDSTPCRTRERT